MPGWLRAVIRFVLAIWFRSVETVGVDNAPARGPLLVVGNHENGLLDPMLVAAYLPVAPRFLGKSTLWKIPVLWPFLVAARVIPVARKQDQKEGADMSKNAEMFARVSAALSRGDVVALFPEGESHNEPGMLPLKTGAARMCLSGPMETRFLPVGIAFALKHRFRGRALLVVGEPFDPAPIRAAEPDPKKAAHAITEAIAAELKKVTINVPTWEERKLLERAVEIARTEEATLEARVRNLKTFTEAYRAFSGSHPEEVEALRREIRQYDRLLRTLGVTDAEVRARYRRISVVNWFIRFVRLFLLRLPLAISGVLLHAIPYQIPRLVARSKAEEPDQPASYKMMAGVVIYPLWWALLAAVAWWIGGDDLALMAAIAVPISAWTALRWMENGLTLAEEARGFLLRGRRRELLQELRERRNRIGDGIAAFEKDWRARAAAAGGDQRTTTASGSTA